MSYSEYVGRQEVRSEVLQSASIERLAATLGTAYIPGAALAPTWHWLMFQEWSPLGEIGPDGHARRGGFLPPLEGLTRRMRAGGRLEFRGELFAGDSVTRTRTIAAISEKQGASGRLVFVKLHDEFATTAGVALLEDQEIVYRGDTPLGPAPVNEPPLAQRHHVQVDSVMLFRYSALTGNSHRIHYDADYARDVEHHNGLVIHGPLQASWLAALASRTATLAAFSFRARRPAYLANAPFTTEVSEERSALRLQTRDRHGTVCMEATATPR